MVRCPICFTDIKEFEDGKNLAHLCVSLNQSSTEEKHMHVHGDIENKLAMTEIIDAAIQETGLENIFVKKIRNQIEKKEIVFHNRQRIGDILMFTCAIRDFKKAFPDVKVGVISTAMHIWDNNPYIDRSLVATEENIVKIGPGKLTNASNRIDWHFANAYRVSMEDALNVYIPQGESRPDIWLTQEEYDAPRITEKPYWIIVTGGEKGWGCKMYPSVRWQEVIDQNPDILFYQIGAKGDNHVRLKGKNVVDYIGKTEDRATGVRDLFKLFLNAEGSMGLVSFHMHLSGALNKPCVVVAGAREPVSFTRYAGHQYIANDGCLPCAVTACWHCDISSCTNLVDYKGNSVFLKKDASEEERNLVMPKCVDLIKSEEVTRYLRRYYDGGRLRLDKPSDKPNFKNIVETPEKIDIPVEEQKVYNTYGLTFNGGALTQKDWEFIQSIIKKYNVKSVLEFGAGLSTLLLNDIGLEKVVTYEDKQGWIDKLKKIKSSCDIRLWDGKNLIDNDHYDLAFVDGPSGDFSREQSTKIASEKCKVIVVHDAGREWARKYQDQYIAPSFHGPLCGGHRSAAWSKEKMPVCHSKERIN